MKFFWKNLLVLMLTITGILALSNSAVSVHNHSNQNNNLLMSEKMQRYDSLNLVDQQALDYAIAKTNAKINKIQDFSSTIDGITYDYQDLLHESFQKETLLQTTDNFHQHTESNNYMLSAIFPYNYDGVYFPWWGFGDYFYWYMSSNTVRSVDQILNGAKKYIIPQIVTILTLAQVPVIIAKLVGLIFDTIVWTWNYQNLIEQDDGNGVYVGVSILPVPFFVESGKQSTYVSDVDTFEVSYAFLAHDYITVSVNAQGINIILNFIKGNISINAFKEYLKELKPVDNTGWLGEISESDYDDFIKAIQNSDTYVNKKFVEASHLEFFANSRKFKSINIQTRRATPDNYQYWQNS